MDRRLEELSKLRSYAEEIDKDMTMILQSLQWDRKHILQHPTLETCRYDSNHRMMRDGLEGHEQECLLRNNGYTNEDTFLPDPLDVKCSTVIKFSKEEIAHIIDDAAKSDPTFKKGMGSGSLEPQTLGRLQCAYSSDERRVIHDAVVSAAPSCHDLIDLALPSTGDNEQSSKTKSRTEILAELRDMRRRRTKYRVAAKSRNYSVVLRDVIKTQMELYNETLAEVDKKPLLDELNSTINKQTHNERDTRSTDNDVDRNRRRDRSSSDFRYDRYNGRSRERHDEHRSKNVRERDNSRDRRYHRDHKDQSRERIHDLEHRKPEKRRNRSRERRPDRVERDNIVRDRVEIKLEKPDRNSRQDKSHDKHRDRSDGERAKNLIIEIKREIESGESRDRKGEDPTYKGSIEINHAIYYRDYISRASHQPDDRDGSRGHKSAETNARMEIESRDRNRSRDHKKHKRDYDEGRETRREDHKHKRSKDERHKANHSVKSQEARESYHDKGSKKSRTEEKHRLYHEIYTELGSRKEFKSN